MTVYTRVLKPIFRLLLVLCAEDGMTSGRLMKRSGYRRPDILERAEKSGLVEKRDGVYVLTDYGRAILRLYCSELRDVLEMCRRCGSNGGGKLQDE